MEVLYGLGPILRVDRRRIIRRLVRGLEVPQFTDGPDRIERNVGNIRVSTDTVLVSKEERQQLEMILSTEVDRGARVVDGRVTWVWSRDSASRSSNNLAEVLDLVVGQELDLGEGVHSLLVDEDLGCGCAETNALKHGTHCVEGRHGRFWVVWSWGRSASFRDFMASPHTDVITDSNGSQSYVSP